jgi:hypothetical protein
MAAITGSPVGAISQDGDGEIIRECLDPRSIEIDDTIVRVSQW